MSNDADRSLLLVLSAPSGSGKTTLGRRLVEREPGALFSVSVTTRPPRGRERDGVDYHFVSEARFRELVRDGALLEWAQVHDHCYGTPAEPVARAREAGALVLFDIDVQGGLQVKQKHPEAALVLVLPPSYAELEPRLRARGTDSEKAIARRLAAAKSEVERAQGYDYVLINDDLERAFDELCAIVTAERCRRWRFNLTRLGF